MPADDIKRHSVHRRRRRRKALRLLASVVAFVRFVPKLTGLSTTKRKTLNPQIPESDRLALLFLLMRTPADPATLAEMEHDFGPDVVRRLAARRLVSANHHNPKAPTLELSDAGELLAIDLGARHDLPRARARAHTKRGAHGKEEGGAEGRKR